MLARLKNKQHKMIVKSAQKARNNTKFQSLCYFACKVEANRVLYIKEMNPKEKEVQIYHGK